jgi:hypothetical protein
MPPPRGKETDRITNRPEVIPSQKVRRRKLRPLSPLACVVGYWKLEIHMDGYHVY